MAVILRSNAVIDGKAYQEVKEYEYASWARDYRDRFLNRVSDLGGVGDVTIWIGR